MRYDIFNLPIRTLGLLSFDSKSFSILYTFLGMADGVTPMTGPRERQTQRQGLKGISTLLLSIATFNVLGLSDHAKRYDLAKDCYNYNIDILAIQETKCIESEDYIIVYVDDNGDKHQYRLIIFEQKHGKTHAGLGFMINCKLLHCFTTYVLW